MAVFQSYQASAGNREDLINVIENISHTETPLLSTLGRGKATSTKHEWLTDTVAGGTSVNKIVEGATTTFPTLAARTRVSNYTQILEEPFQVSDTQEAMNPAGIASEFGYQMKKAMQELAVDIEYSLVNGASAVGASGTAREMNGVVAAITTNVNSATAARALTNTIYNDGLQTVFANSKVRISDIFAGGFQKRQISGFSTANTRYVDVAGKKLQTAIDVYEGDFGRQKIHLHYQIGAAIPGTLIGLDPSYWKTAWLQPVKTEKLAKDGGNLKARAWCELTLEYRNEKSGVKWSQLTTS